MKQAKQLGRYKRKPVFAPLVMPDGRYVGIQFRRTTFRRGDLRKYRLISLGVNVKGDITANPGGMTLTDLRRTVAYIREHYT